MALNLPSRVRGLALDVDGTVTVDRASYILDLELASLLRRLQNSGVRIMFVTGNALPVIAGLARYLGLWGPHVAENGCLIFDAKEERIITLCSRSCRVEAEHVSRELGRILTPSWQNVFRLYDFAFRVKSVDARQAVNEVRRILDELGSSCIVSYSGYAVHIRPPEARKSRGLLEALDIAGLKPEEVIAVGDSTLDAEMAEAGVLLAAVANADEELKKRANIVLPEPSSRGVAYLVKLLLFGSNPS